MNRSIPVINTARLSLRPFRLEDFERYAEIWADAQVVREIGGKPRSRGESWTSFLCNAGHWQMSGFGQWAVTDARSRQVIGQVGFFYGTRELGEDFDSFPEAGWVLAPETWRQGLGREAVAAAHAWFDRVIAGPLVALVTEANAASLRLAEGQGYAEMRRETLDGRRMVLVKRLRPPAGG